MAHSDKNIVITPSIGSTTTDPRIVFSGADATLGPQNITLRAYPTNSGTLSFEGSAGQLFSITNSLTGTIFSVNDVSGIPSIEVLDTGTVRLAQYGGNVGIGTASPTSKLTVYDNTVGAITTTIGDGVAASVRSTRYSTDTSSPNVGMFKYRGTLASPLSVASNDIMGQLNFNAYGGTTVRNIAQVQGQVETYTSDTNISSYLTFSTTPAGGTTLTERLRLGSAGQLGLSGANYGTSGQVLTSSGASAAPTWSTPTSVTIGLTPPVSPSAGALWWDSYNGALKIYYTDGDTSQWVDAFIASGGITTNDVITALGYTPYNAANPSGYVSTAVTSAVAGTGVSVSAGTGAVTFSIGQAVATSSSVQFGSLGVGFAASGTAGEIRATNNVTAFYSSDARLKENVREIPNALDKVSAIGGKLYSWTDEYIASHGGLDPYFLPKESFGVIAQDVEQVFPEAVRTREDGYLAVDYEKMCALAFQAIKELQEKVNTLEQQIKGK